MKACGVWCGQEIRQRSEKFSGTRTRQGIFQSSATISWLRLRLNRCWVAQVFRIMGLMLSGLFKQGWELGEIQRLGVASNWNHSQGRHVQRKEWRKTGKWKHSLCCGLSRKQKQKQNKLLGLHRLRNRGLQTHSPERHWWGNGSADY